MGFLSCLSPCLSLSIQQGEWELPSSMAGDEPDGYWQGSEQNEHAEVWLLSEQRWSAHAASSPESTHPVDGERDESLGARRRTWIGHPPGLWVLCAMEAWERYSYYAMRSLLVLFLLELLADPATWEKNQVIGIRLIKAIFGTPKDGEDGRKDEDEVGEVVSQLYGTYTAMVYGVTPLGGALADRLTGQTLAILGGGAVICVGHAMLTDKHTFFLGLLLIVVGTGALKPNVSTQVGQLYPGDDSSFSRAWRQRGFSAFYVAVNVGATVSPLVAGSLHAGFGFSVAFASAAVGMVISMVIYVIGWRYLPFDARRRSESESRFQVLNRTRGLRLVAIIAVCALATPFWAAFEQQGNALARFFKEGTERQVGSFEVPVEFAQSLNPILILLLTPALSWVWTKQSRRNKEPDDMTKMASGCLILASGFAVLASATASIGLPISPGWIFLATFLWTVGELHTSPTGLAFVTASAPLGLQSFSMSLWFFFTGTSVYSLPSSFHPVWLVAAMLLTLF